MSKLNIAHADLLLAMDAPKRQAATQTGEDVANREGKLSTLLTAARTKGMVTLQAATILKGWTRVYHGAVTENVKPAEVANMIVTRAKAARELAQADVPHDVDYVGITAIASTSLKPSPSARLGGRWYVICTETLDEIPEPEYASMVADVDERSAIALTAARPIKVEKDEDESEDESK